MIYNVLDNALEASPGWVGLDVSRDAGAVKLDVLDSGPGFPAEMLAQLGKPYQSTKDVRAPGSDSSWYPM